MVTVNKKSMKGYRTVHLQETCTHRDLFKGKCRKVSFDMKAREQIREIHFLPTEILITLWSIVNLKIRIWEDGELYISEKGGNPYR